VAAHPPLVSPRLQASQKASDERRAAAEKRLKDAELRCEALEEEYTKYRKNQRRREDGGVFAGAACCCFIGTAAASRPVVFAAENAGLKAKLECSQQLVERVELEQQQLRTALHHAVKEVSELKNRSRVAGAEAVQARAFAARDCLSMSRLPPKFC
jgi:hypothetical protein